LTDIHPSYSLDIQQDASEFLIRLLEHIKVSSPDDNPVKSVFDFQVGLKLNFIQTYNEMRYLNRSQKFELALVAEQAQNAWIRNRCCACRFQRNELTFWRIVCMNIAQWMIRDL
jgi:uncharacterized UBP type Zn finger protein